MVGEESMNQKILLVVSDKFSQFANIEDVVTFSELLEEIRKESSELFSGESYVLFPGQGISDADIEKIIQIVTESIYSKKIDLSLWLSRPKRADRAKSHKVYPENTLISQPERLSENEFKLELLVDENCELLGDHQTGQHLQAMLLLEAARQSFIAVTETYFASNDGTKRYFIFNDIEARYNSFAFPLAANINYVVRENDLIKSERPRFVVDISINQYGVNAAEFKLDITSFKDKVITKKEAMLADKIVHKCIMELSDQFSDFSKAANDENIND